MGFTGFYWVLLGFTGFYWFLLGSIVFYWVLLGFTGFLLVFFSGFCRDLKKKPVGRGPVWRRGPLMNADRWQMRANQLVGGPGGTPTLTNGVPRLVPRMANEVVRPVASSSLCVCVCVCVFVSTPCRTRVPSGPLSLWLDRLSQWRHPSLSHLDASITARALRFEIWATKASIFCFVFCFVLFCFVFVRLLELECTFSRFWLDSIGLHSVLFDVTKHLSFTWFE